MLRKSSVEWNITVERLTRPAPYAPRPASCVSVINTHFDIIHGAITSNLLASGSRVIDLRADYFLPRLVDTDLVNLLGIASHTDGV